STHPVELVWRMDVTSKEIGMPIRELVLVNAQRGNISLHFNQVDMAWHSDSNLPLLNHLQNSNKARTKPTGFESLMFLTLSSHVSTYTSNGGSTLPGTFLCNQSDPN